MIIKRFQAHSLVKLDNIPPVDSILKKNYCLSRHFIRCSSNCPSQDHQQGKNVAVNRNERVMPVLLPGSMESWGDHLP